MAYEWMDMPKPDWTGVDAIVNQCNGSLLPTDDADTAVRLLRQDIDSLVNYYSVSFEVPEFDPNNVADVNRIRYQAEEELDKVKEVRYAKKQKECHGEIGEYLKLLAGGKFSSRLSGDDEIAVSIPKSEAPAYMEWAVWRAFLALNSMVNKPYEARRFNVDKDFLPMSTAPGGGSDLVIEYEDFVLAVEVTLTKNSRQEAAEGEPVRRHVADLMSRYPEKDVIGLFIANGIDSNTAETFRHGTWYYPDDSKARLSIVPLTTSNFSKLFTASFEHGYTGPALIVRAIHACDAVKEGLDAPRWKQEIDVLIMDLLESGEVNYSEL